MKDSVPVRSFVTKGEDMTKYCVFHLNTVNSIETKLTFGQIRIGDPVVTVKI